MNPQEWLDYLLRLANNYRSVKEVTYRDNITFQITVKRPALIRQFFEAVNKTSFTRQLDVMNDTGLDDLARLQLNIEITDQQVNGTYALYWSDDAEQFEINQFKQIVSDEYSFLAGRMSFSRNPINKHKIPDMNIVKSWLKRQVTSSSSFESSNVKEEQWSFVKGGYSGLRNRLIDTEGHESNGVEKDLTELLEETADELLNTVRNSDSVANIFQHAQEVDGNKISFIKTMDRKTFRFRAPSVTTPDEEFWFVTLKLDDIDETMAGVNGDDVDEVKENLLLAIKEGDIRLECEADGFLYWSSEYILSQLDSHWPEGNPENRFPDDRNPELSFSRALCKHTLVLLEELAENRNDELLTDMAESIQTKVERGVYGD